MTKIAGRRGWFIDALIRTREQLELLACEAPAIETCPGAAKACYLH